MTRRLARLLGLVVALSLCGLVSAQDTTRAWLDRDRIALGETTTLNIETQQPGVDAPDWSVLDREFEATGHTSRRQVELRDGRRVDRTLFAVALRPRREGVLTVPALRIGAETTAPLPLSVGPARIAGSRDGAPAFIEAEVDVQSPYVQQSVGYTLRLYYATQLVSGQLDQPAPDGAALQRVGDDVQYAREIDGRRYAVVERRFQIVPERSGTLTIPGAHFEGRGVGGSGMFDDIFNRGPRLLQANGPPSVLTVRPVPAGAPQPWLPLYAVEARWLDAPRDARAGEATTLVAEVRYDGSVAAQLPELRAPAVPGAQVFAEPPQIEEHFDGGRPQVVLVRRFSIVPDAPGTLQVPGPGIAWWDARAGTARTTALPPVTLQVAPGSGPAVSAPSNEARTPSTGSAPDAPVWRWPVLAGLAGAALLLAALAWRRRRITGQVPPAMSAAVAAPRTTPLQLRQLLQSGGQDDVSAALCALVTPPAASLDALRTRLRDPAQRDALDQWQRARWAQGDVAAARAALQAAFRDGADTIVDPGPAPATRDTLPPLYPPR
ncbi:MULTISPECIES: BatD family protein [Luteimonas]|uniref:BatD family protein n=1 Tax=Luteimonas TaxID=83614 RepID=UPI000C798BC2|nr:MULTISPECIES: BatD family protein [Luteimonas]